MLTNRQSGDQGELEVIRLMPCPNCGKALMSLPPNYPLYDVQDVLGTVLTLIPHRFFL